MIGAILGPVITIAGDWLKGYQEVKVAERKTKIAIEKNKARLALDKNSCNHEWEMASLAGADKFLRRMSFFLFVMPFVVAIVSPEIVRNYFAVGLEPIPDWYKKIVIGMVGGIWGLSELKNIIPGISGSLKDKR